MKRKFSSLIKGKRQLIVVKGDKDKKNIKVDLKRSTFPKNRWSLSRISNRSQAVQIAPAAVIVTVILMVEIILSELERIVCINY